MKAILFLSRFTFICNIAFLLFAFFRWLEVRKPVQVPGDKVINVPFFKELIITLGFTAIVINLIMNVIYLILVLSGKIRALPGWLIAANFLFLILQVYYYFFFNY